MNESKFWELISLIDTDLLQDGDDDGSLEELRSALRSLPAVEIKAFEDILAERLWNIDRRDVAEFAGDSGRSGDGFLYSRCYIVARGKDYYRGVLASAPTDTTLTVDEWCEPLLYVAQEAWEEITGEEWDHSAPLSYETGSNADGWAC